ncbi:uncharacterized protein FIESC28_08500 [Fusarium coffeatum]|uniref:Uncharacterized protein n=1 Tax=Fusarium coffeatum TaxID=231269 RepID=A0A366R8C6_9HYPO|nr:uncharacterized protein FIESC28_08500 [Fusarium coffeatum]RBR12798.1 hypothetical protein FIESC28_08500 [Fusarium coffeatum]
MASDLLGKIKETLVPSNTENSESYNSNTNTFGSNTNNASFNPGSSLNSNSYNDVTENSSNQREFGSTNRNTGLESEFNRNAGLESTSNEYNSNRTSGLESSNQTQHNEGGRTQRVRSLVENVPGVPETFTSSSSSTSTSQSKPTFDTPSYQKDMHHRHFDAARAPPSALRAHLGEPSIEHDHPHESSTKRHSSISHQEEHYNLN